MSVRNRKVNFQTFSWFAGAVLLIFGFLFTQVGSAQDKATQAIEGTAELNTQVQVIKTDVGWIRKTMQNQINQVEKVETEAWVKQRAYDLQEQRTYEGN